MQPPALHPATATAGGEGLRLCLNTGPTPARDISEGEGCAPLPLPMCAGGPATGSSAGPVLLVLGTQLHGLPWESMPCMRGQEVYRSACLMATCATAAGLAVASSSASAAAVAGTKGKSAGGRKAAAVSQPPSSNPTPPLPQPQLQLDLSSTFYLLNPGGDLLETQQSFEPWFSSIGAWQVTQGSGGCTMEGSSSS